MNWVGAILLTASAYWIGQRLASEEGDKLKTLDSIIIMLKYIRRRIISERIPLHILFSSYEDDFLEKNGFLPLMRSCRNGLPQLWAESVRCLSVEPEIERELLHFGSELGILPLEEQILRIDSCVDALETAKSDSQRTLPAKQKTLKTVSLLAGTLTAIILL